MAMKKSELIAILVDDYGYEKEDLKYDAQGNPLTNAKLQAMIDAEERDAQELEDTKYRVVAKKQTIKDDEKISVMSGSMGTVIYRSELTSRLYKFTKFGQMDKMPYSELVAIHNRFGGYFTDGWIVILDSRVQEEFGLLDMYKNILTPQNIDGIFKKSASELEVLIDNLPDGMKLSFINKAQELYEKDQIESHKVIKMIEEKFGFSLNDNAPINDLAVESKVGRDGIIYVNKE
jgi:hypothetical protein